MSETANPESPAPRPAPRNQEPLRALFDAEAALVAERRRIARQLAQRTPGMTPSPTPPTPQTPTPPEAKTAAPVASPEAPASEDDASAHDALPRVGLAISGGGVRSATFGLGLLRGLAGNRLLSRVDYLSTVSGGGFVGAMFGRLVTFVGIEEAQAQLARSTSPVLEWLRRNGRYLSPSGARDLGIAAATYLRAIVAIHAETLLLCLPFVLTVLLPHLLVQGFGGFDPAGWPDWHTPWWPMALLVLVLCVPGLMAAYWIARENLETGPRGMGGAWRDIVIHALVAAAALAFSVLAWPDPGALARGDGGALFVFGSLIALWSSVAGLSYTRWTLRRTPESRALAVARLREKLTKALRIVLLAAVVAAGAGALDAVSWWLLEALQSGETWVWGGVGLGSAGIVLLRALAQPLQLLAERAKVGTGTDWGPRLLNLGGAVGLLALVLAWMVAAQWFVFAPEPARAVRDLSPGVRAFGLLALTTLWWLLSARNAHMANATSLHGFYRARLTAAYLAIGNEKRDLVRGGVDRVKASVREVVQGDDTSLPSYTPETRGGPIHLVNVTLNQTHDDASGLYNADRKGTLVTASARALEVGPDDAALLRECDTCDVGTLGRWVAASGAAASPGAGSYTSAGWALLLFFLGVRLGYWLRAPLPPEGAMPPRVARGWRRFVKPLMLWSEAAAAFYGRARPWWYLSDGGHFDNTGVYPLLKRRLDFIILADNGADAHYQFADLENLVRKARIDFGAEIEFYTREEAARHFPSADGSITVLAPEDIADNHSSRGVLLARVRYAPDADGRRAEATLLVVKPNLHDALDLDLLAYAQRHPTFPHESTGDQSFDEAQWESYQRLGQDFGRALDPAWLARLPGWTQRGAHPMTVAARLTGEQADAGDVAPEPLWRRSARATALGATLGLSASGTLLLAVWQVSDQFRQNVVSERTEAQRLFAEVSRDLRDLDGTCPKVDEHTAVQLMMLRDLRASPRLQPLEREGVSQLIEHVRGECEQQPQPSVECAEAVQRAAAGVCAVVNRPPTETGALSYWHPIETRITLASLFGAVAHDTVVASAPTIAPPADAQVAARSAAPAAPVTRGGDAPYPARSDGAASAASDEVTRAEAERPASAAAPPPPPPTSACERNERPVQVFVQIYDEASRDAANAVVRALRKDSGDVLRVAPIENVTRAAALRDQRRPVPWPQPTLIVHDPVDHACAVELAATVRAALPAVGGRDAGVWVRDLPRTLKPSPGVIELWIPPRDGESAAAK